MAGVDDSADRPQVKLPAPRLPRAAVCLVPSGGRHLGQVAFRGCATVDGHVDGLIRARGELRVGPAALVRGDIEAEVLIVQGTVEGDVRASERVRLEPTARVCGSLETPVLMMADGSVLEGRCLTGPLPEPGEMLERSSSTLA